jgi:hypothetical protein
LKHRFIMAETDHSSSPDIAPAEPPAGGRQDHTAMRDASMRPVSGPASTDTLAASGGLEVPGGERESSSQFTLPDVNPQQDGYELIPGARESDTLTYREPGGMGGQFNGADLAAAGQTDSLDERTAAERAREGGGGSLDLARKRNELYERESAHE